MAASCLPYEPKQQLLVPPTLQEWLPEGHLAYYIGDTVDTLDLSAFDARYEKGGPRHKRAITKALQAGFRLSDTVVVTFSGREKSLLAPYDQLGPHNLKRWLGRYDLFGAPQFSEGELLVETVYRFKGQSAPCVVLTEVDFETFDELAQRKLFVGMTRASMKLILVLSERAAKMLLAKIGDGEARP